MNGKRSFNTAFGTGGTDVFDYFISNRDVAEWERGTGHMSASTTLVRDTVIASSNANNAVNFSAGMKDVTNDIPAAKHAWFDSGVSQLFFNSTAPVGWTKQTTHNDKAIRLVTGTPSTGGSSAFSTVFGKTATDSHTLTTAEIPAHAHNFDGSVVEAVGSSPAYTALSAGGNWTAFSATQSTGSGGGHTHPMDIRVQYVDAIICDKN